MQAVCLSPLVSQPTVLSQLYLELFNFIQIFTVFLPHFDSVIVKYGNIAVLFLVINNCRRYVVFRSPATDLFLI